MMFVIFAKYFNGFPRDVVACPFILFSMAFIHSARVSLVKPLILLIVYRESSLRYQRISRIYFAIGTL